MRYTLKRNVTVRSHYLYLAGTEQIQKYAKYHMAKGVCSKWGCF